MILHGVEFDQHRIAELCRKHGIARLSLFGSILSEQFRPDSDIDILVEFLPNRTPGLITFAGIQIELSELLGRRVDLRTPNDLSPLFRTDVMRRARLQFAA